MKISKETLEIIKNFSVINPSIKFQKGNVLITASEGGDIIAKAVLADSFPITFLIHDLSSFCSTISLLKDPEIEFEESFCVIRSGRKKIHYYYSDSRVVRSVKSIKQDFDYSATFDLSKDDLTDLTKLAASTSTDELGFLAEETEVTCKCYDLKKAISTTVEVSHPVKEFKKKIEVSVPMSVLNFLKRDYTVKISDIVVCFDSENLSYFVRATYRR